MKFTSDIRLLHNFNEKHQLATRLMGGIIYSYGNKTIAPYSEQFYVGGANSIRAFTIRSIGPGSFHPKESAAYSYVDETGDLKLEANAEYRFRLLSNLAGGNLNGAVFWMPETYGCCAMTLPDREPSLHSTSSLTTSP